MGYLMWSKGLGYKTSLLIILDLELARSETIRPAGARHLSTCKINFKGMEEMRAPWVLLFVLAAVAFGDDSTSGESMQRLAWWPCLWVSSYCVLNKG